MKLVLRIHPPIGSVSELEWSKLDSQIISDSCKKFEVHQRFIRQRVETALQEYARGQASFPFSSFLSLLHTTVSELTILV